MLLSQAVSTQPDLLVLSSCGATQRMVSASIDALLKISPALPKGQGPMELAAHQGVGTGQQLETMCCAWLHIKACIACSVALAAASCPHCVAFSTDSQH